MRKIFVMVGLFLNSFVFGQVAEDFSDGEVLHHPQWLGDTGRVLVNTKKQLQSRLLSKSDTLQLATSNKQLLNTTWEYYLQINTDPSTSNQIRIYLAFDKANLDSSGNGYFIQVGETGSQDSYDLFRKTGRSLSKIIDGPPKPRSSIDTIKIWIMVIHRTDGLWELYTRSDTLLPWDSEGFTNERMFTSCNFTGYTIKHTSTRSDKFILDNIKIYPYDLDTSGPEFIHAEFIDDTTFAILFSEEIDTIGVLNPNLYSANFTIFPKRVKLNLINKSLIELIFSNRFNSGKINIIGPRISDLLGNKADSLKFSFNYIAPYRVMPKDIFISEIMVDPIPKVNLPEAEFIELHNSTSNYINLFNWTLVNGASNIKFPNITMEPNGYLIICKSTDTNLFKSYGKTLGFATWPNINNTIGTLKIRNEIGEIMDEVNYKNSWYKNNAKMDGGYSLEFAKSLKTCNDFYYWQASASQNGGSPGKVNSIVGAYTQSDQTLFIDQFDYINDSSIYISFNKSPDTVGLKHTSNFSLSDQKINPKKVIPIGEFYDEFVLVFNQKFKRNNFYYLKLLNIKSCENQTLDDQVFNFVYRDDDDTSLLRINEIFADPSPSIKLPELEFIEIFNTTKNYVNVSSYTLTIGSTKLILPNFTIKPNEFIIICGINDTSSFKTYGRCIGLNNFPLLSNIGSTISLNNKVGRLIDKVSYKSNWYRDITKSDGGWSLELIDPYTKCDFINRWKASKNHDGGSPGKNNSIAEFYTDKKDLSIISLKENNNQNFELIFNKGIDGRTLNIAQIYFVGPKMKLFFPITMKIDSPYYERVQFSLKNPLVAGTYNLVCQYIPTCSRNDTNIFLKYEVKLEEIPSVDLMITEIMSDPSPSIGLPETEYIELYNASEHDIMYGKYYISNSKDTLELNIELLKANHYLLLCDKTYRMSWSEDANVYALNSMLSLNNEGDTITLFNYTMEVIDRVIYNPDKLEGIKKDGGYSFTKLTGTMDCQSELTWIGSINEMGGTPGFANESINEIKLKDYEIIEINWLDSASIIIETNPQLERNNSFIIENNNEIQFNYFVNEEGKLLLISDKSIDEGKEIEMHLVSTNCIGIKLDTIFTIYSKYIPQKKELLISEILFNPIVGGVDFVELYNNSNSVIDLHEIEISNGLNSYKLGDIANFSTNNRYLLSKKYTVLSISNSSILEYFSVPEPSALIECNKLISMPDEGGNILILNSNKEIIDHLEYSKDWHLSWLENIEGRSLERKNFERETNSRENWASATDNYGKGSPTGKNSQYSSAEEISDKSFWLSNSIVNPEKGIGNKQLEINYEISGETSLIRVRLFNLSGEFVAELFSDLSIRNNGVLPWDLAIDGKLLEMGTYILSIESYLENGHSEFYKLPFVIHY